MLFLSKVGPIDLVYDTNQLFDRLAENISTYNTTFVWKTPMRIGPILQSRIKKTLQQCDDEAQLLFRKLQDFSMPDVRIPAIEIELKFEK